MVAVTGASGGVGRAVVREFAKRGDSIAMLARGEVGLAATAAEVTVAGATPMVVPVDVADPFQIEAAVARIEDELGPIDIWVNSAFTSIFAPFAEISPEEFKRVTEVTYLGAVYATMAVLRRMRERDAGTIVHVGSTLATAVRWTAYCGAKHAPKGFPRVAALRAVARPAMSGDDGAAASGEHSAVLVGAVPAASARVGAADLPAESRRAFTYAVDQQTRRFYWRGASTAATLIMNAVVPGLLDRYLARTGFKAQQTGRPKDPDQPANLWEPADGRGGHDFGAHGAFDQRAKPRSAQVFASQHHKALLGAAAAAGAGLTAAVGRKARRS